MMQTSNMPVHVLPKSFHRIRHYGPLASAARKANVAYDNCSGAAG
jgi:Putative transposase